MKEKLDKIEDAIEDIRIGKFVIVVDDEDRENEGDFICAAEKITPEMINFMLKNGRGVLCAPLTEERCDALELEIVQCFCLFQPGLYLAVFQYFQRVRIQ